ncbi:MAG: amidohydrolase, partial [Methylobacteriaceae bacterium]|nr:amidohydrolase [Methylobacteriaceae bacterium]
MTLVRLAGRVLFADGTVRPAEIAIKEGRIAAIARGLGGGAREEVRGGGRLICSGFVDTHIHLEKSCILERC